MSVKLQTNILNYVNVLDVAVKLLDWKQVLILLIDTYS